MRPYDHVEIVCRLPKEMDICRSENQKQTRHRDQKETHGGPRAQALGTTFLHD
jgi:hypothetical protein